MENPRDKSGSGIEVKPKKISFLLRLYVYQIDKLEFLYWNN